MLNTTSASLNRHFEVDVLRGLAIVLMVVFHFCYDLTAFGWASYNTHVDIEWQIFRAIIVSGFLLAVGMSSYLAYFRKFEVKRLVLAVSKLLIVAAWLTAGSLILYPNTWVYFGIIHFIAVALPVSVLFVRVPNIALITGVFSIVGYWMGVLDLHFMWQWSVANIGIPEHTTDLVSFFPWIGCVLIGVYLMHKKLFSLKLRPKKVFRHLAFLGRHSLLIYLIHQPILYSILGAVEWAYY